MPATAQPANGVTLSYSTDAGVTWVVVGQVKSLQGVGGCEIGRRDTTVLASSRHTSRPTIPTPQDIEMDMNFDPTDTAHQQIRDWAEAPATADPQWKVTYPWTATPNKCVFTGYVANFDGVSSGDVDENAEASLTVCRNTASVWS
jgi:hypothetical protein